MPDSTALEPTVIDEDLCRRCVGKLQPPTERQGEGSSDAKKETAQREIKYLMFSYKNILKIDNLVGFDKLVKLQLDNNIIETIEYGWPCDDADADATKRGKCEEGGGAVEQSGNQCICALSTTFYPKGIEDLKLAFEHEYRSTDKLFNPILKGSSFNSAAEPKLDPVIKYAAVLSVQPLMEPSLLTTITGR